MGGIQAYLWELWRRLDPSSFAVLTASSHRDASTFDAEQRREGLASTESDHRCSFPPRRRAPDPVRGAGDRSVSASSSIPPYLSGLVGRWSDCRMWLCCTAQVTIPLVCRCLRRYCLVSDGRAWSTAGDYPAAEARRPPGAPCRRRREIPPGVDTEPLPPVRDRGVQGETGVRLPEDGPLVVSVSRLVPRKGMDVLMRRPPR